MKYLAKLNKKTAGFIENKIYKVTKNCHDRDTMNWFVIQREDGEQTLIHCNSIEILGLNSEVRNEAIYVS